MKFLVFLTVLLTLMGCSKKKDLAKAPEPKATPTPGAPINIGRYNLFALGAIGDENVTAKQCVAINMASPKISKQDEESLLSNPVLKSMGEEFCKILRPNCEKKVCAAIEVNGRGAIYK